MLASARDFAQAKGFIAPLGYGRHRPEATLLYRLVAEHYPRFRDRRAAEGKPLPRYVDEVLPRVPTRQWVLSLPLPLRYLSATRPEVVTQVLGIVYGTTHVMFEPEDFIARLIALVPKPRAHLTRYHGVFAPASALRSRVVPRPGTRRETEPPDQTEVQRHRAMTWAQRLKRVFAIDIERCRRCGGRLEVIPSSGTNGREHRGTGSHHTDPRPSRA